MSDQIDPMAEIKASFFVECEELLESLQDSLQAMDDGEDDAETINVVFRAVHSIKGGAGAFGLDELVGFAHRYETVLDHVRSGELVPDANAHRIFFSSADMLSDLVRASRDEETVDKARKTSILTDLDALIGADPTTEEDPEIDPDDFQPMVLSLDLDGAGDDTPLPDLADLGELTSLDHDDGEALEADDDASQCGYRIVFRPHVDLYATNNEPLFMLRTLRKMGDAKIVCHHDSVPVLSKRDGDSSFLAWTIDLRGDVERSTVDEVFEFVNDLCDLEITALAEDNDSPPNAVKESALDVDADRTEPDTSVLTAEPPQVQESEKPTPELKEAATAALSSVPSDSVPAGPAAPQAASQATKPAQAKPQPAKATVRVDLEKIDRLVNLVGELVINQAMLTQSVSAAGIPANSAVAQGLEEFMQLTRDVQDSVMLIRAQPVKSLFQRMSRIVRETSAAIGKDVRLRTEGEGTEVDKTVIERLADPLTHMIRNAVDHGLETTEQRELAGKPKTGTVSLVAAHRSGRVIIEVSDDGGGINRKRVQDIATEKGLIPANSTLSDAEIDNLLFLPGFSTASEISALSGRGVGMDVVKSSIQALGGRVSITSQSGVGTTFSISLPLTLAVLDGMVVEVAGETLVVPLNAIVETLTLTPKNLRVLGKDGHVVEIRGGFAPLIDLGVELGYRDALPDYSGKIVLVIGLEDGSKGTLVVDAIHDQRQVVIKGLQPGFGDVPGVAAATILGDGQIALILDPIDLTKHPVHRDVQLNSAERKVG